MSLDPELVIVVPSRERPDALRDLITEFQATCTSLTTVYPVVDDNDPTAELYPQGTVRAPSRNMVQALNWAVVRLLATDNPPFAVGFMGDDHRPITRGWDTAYLDALHEMGTGIVYGNDLLQGKRLPTQVAMTADIPRALGYIAPPAFGHLFVDNAWKAWGERARCLRYLDEILIEHRHPLAFKSEWDAGYHRVNSDAQQRADRQRWGDYQRMELDRDVRIIEGLTSGDGKAAKTNARF